MKKGAQVISIQFNKFLQSKYTYLCINNIKYSTDPLHGSFLPLHPSPKSNHYPEFYTVLSFYAGLNSTAVISNTMCLSFGYLDYLE